jgi:hypothetical protein
VGVELEEVREWGVGGRRSREVGVGGVVVGGSCSCRMSLVLQLRLVFIIDRHYYRILGSVKNVAAVAPVISRVGTGG